MFPLLASKMEAIAHDKKCRWPLVGTESRPQLAVSKEMGTLDTQLQGTGFCQQPERAGQWILSQTLQITAGLDQHLGFNLEQRPQLNPHRLPTSYFEISVCCFKTSLWLFIMQTGKLIPSILYHYAVGFCSVGCF